MAKIRCAVVGVGNCFAGLVQGIEYYKRNPGEEVIGVMSPIIGGYSIHDLDFVAAFDVDSKKVGKPLNEARNVAESTLVAIMGRISAYTGQIVRWSDLTKNMNSPWYNLTLMPTARDFEEGTVVAPPENSIPLPGEA